MAPRRIKARTNSNLEAFGRRFRRYREAKGWSQANVAARANNGLGVTPQYIGMIETGRSRCTREFAEAMDIEFGADGALVDLWDDLVEEAAYPSWFDWVSVEQEAASLHAFELGVVTGLLQSRPYAAEILGDEKAVEARMKRQAILTREEPPPPEMVVLLDKSVLYRDVGGPEVMRGQLEFLANSVSDRLAIQLVPMRLHRGISGSFVLATMKDRSQVGYVETVARGVTMSDAEDLNRMAESLSSLRAQALPVDMTIDMIKKVIVDEWT